MMKTVEWFEFMVVPGAELKGAVVRLREDVHVLDDVELEVLIQQLEDALDPPVQSCFEQRRL